MNDEDDVHIEPENDSLESRTGDSEEDIAAVEDRAETKVAKLRKELEQVKKEKQENQDGWQRSKADYVNALRRFEEEKKHALVLGKSKAAQAFIPAMDSLERAKETGDLPEGFVGIVKQLERAAESLGITQYGAKGEKFNPMLHEALGQDPTDVQEEDDTITQILESGWKISEEVVRPAKVRVAHFEK